MKEIRHSINQHTRTRDKNYNHIIIQTAFEKVLALMMISILIYIYIYIYILIRKLTDDSNRDMIWNHRPRNKTDDNFDPNGFKTYPDNDSGPKYTFRSETKLIMIPIQSKFLSKNTIRNYLIMIPFLV